MRLALIALCVAAVGCDKNSAPHSPRDRALLADRNTCSYRPEGSSWVTQAAAYEYVAEYGRRNNEEIIDLWGVAANDHGDVLLYDAGNTQVRLLRRDLTFAKAFGREGRGPGEFVYQPIVHGNWIAAADSAFIVLSFQGFMEFSVVDGYMNHRSRSVPFPPDVKRFSVNGAEVMWGVDRVDKHTGARVLETWTLRTDGIPVKARGDQMPSLPIWMGRRVMGAYVLQGDPLWAAHADCVYLSDGAADWILRVGSALERVDTLHLPSRGIPKMNTSDERHFEDLRRAGALMGIVTGNRDVEPTARLKWEDMLVDPDGYIWLRPWRPPSLDEDPITAWIVDPSTGAVDSMIVPQFPSAFLPDRGFIAVGYDKNFRTTFITKFALSPKQ